MSRKKLDIDNVYSIRKRFNIINERHERMLEKLENKKHVEYDFLKRIVVNGFRGLNKCSIDFDSPIVAISGANGSGKTTILSLLSCSYSLQDEASEDDEKFKNNLGILFPRHSEKNYHPYDQSYANVMFEYINRTDGTGKAINTGVKNDHPGAEQKLTISWRENANRWDGYQRRPKRNLKYIGVSEFIPGQDKVRGSFDPYKDNSQDIEIHKSNLNIEKYMTQILSNQYNEFYAYEISNNKNNIKSEEYMAVKRTYENGKSIVYSENNMGFGEGRIARLVKIIEEAKDNSLFLIEEPEIALHGKAQYELLRYLISAAYRKDHQFILSTHSNIILESLPDSSLILLSQDENELKTAVHKGISSYYQVEIDYQVTPQLRYIVICEDDFASKMIHYAFLASNYKQYGRSVGYITANGKDNIKTVLNSLEDLKEYFSDNLRISCVYDGDVEVNELAKHGDFMKFSERNPSINETYGDSVKIFLPGILPPEEVVFKDPFVRKFIEEQCGKRAYLHVMSNEDPHSYYGALRETANSKITEGELKSLTLSEFWKNHNDYSNSLVESILNISKEYTSAGGNVNKGNILSDSEMGPLSTEIYQLVTRYIKLRITKNSNEFAINSLEFNDNKYYGKSHIPRQGYLRVSESGDSLYFNMFIGKRALNKNKELVKNFIEPYKNDSFYKCSIFESTGKYHIQCTLYTKDMQKIENKMKEIQKIVNFIYGL
jgi:hypothetical protein